MRNPVQTSTPKVALVTNVLAHYRVPCFQKLADRMPGYITFFLLTEEMSHRHYVMAKGTNGLPVVTLPGWRWSRSTHDDIHLNDIRPVLRGGYDLIILGAWDEPTYLLLWLTGLLRRQHIMFWIESTAEDGPRSPVKERMKKIVGAFSKERTVRRIGSRENAILSLT